jgi:hypothetical protein
MIKFERAIEAHQAAHNALLAFLPDPALTDYENTVVERQLRVRKNAARAFVEVIKQQ